MIDRAVYLVDDDGRTYRYLRRNASWRDLDPEENQRNKRSLEGFTRVFPGRTKVYRYQAHSRINRQWHEQHAMPTKPTREQRIRWHLEHSQNCGCRPPPESLRAEVEALRRAT